MCHVKWVKGEGKIPETQFGYLKKPNKIVGSVFQEAMKHLTQLLSEDMRKEIYELWEVSDIEIYLCITFISCLTSILKLEATHMGFPGNYPSLSTPSSIQRGVCTVLRPEFTLLNIIFVTSMEIF